MTTETKLIIAGFMLILFVMGWIGGRLSSRKKRS